ncbi:hypothetical protein HHK36_022789 [Tetracentron sinense]|uniref:Uncharacterized protein n=1 Tax=Tetracentron sinense TaxID=13715 RepID=A0A835D968_TETSI|nr:hypothetical protein HHK36_022789 [Tetracentron sinense]
MGRPKGAVSKKKESSQMVCSSQKHQPEISNPSLERAKSSTEMIEDMGTMSSLRKKMLMKTIRRRSERIQNTTLSAQDPGIEPVIEEIDASESDKEDLPCAYDEKKAPETISSERSLEEKFDDLVLLLEAQGKTTEALKSKGSKRCFLSETALSADIRSEIDALRDENYQLGKKLENVTGKLEAYEKGHLVFSDAIEKLKDVIFIASITKTTEKVLDISSARVPAAKKRKLAKGGKKN